jgi:hypothetical protein
LLLITQIKRRNGKLAEVMEYQFNVLSSWEVAHSPVGQTGLCSSPSWSTNRALRGVKLFSWPYLSWLLSLLVLVKQRWKMATSHVQWLTCWFNCFEKVSRWSGFEAYFSWVQLISVDIRVQLIRGLL